MIHYFSAGSDRHSAQTRLDSCQQHIARPAGPNGDCVIGGTGRADGCPGGLNQPFVTNLVLVCEQRDRRGSRVDIHTDQQIILG